MLNRIRSVFTHIKKQQVESIPANRSAIGKQFERCVLHIGTEKTGTSTIQRFMTMNREAFAREGVMYPSVTGKDGGSQWGFVACAQVKSWDSDVGRVLDIKSEQEQELYKETFRHQLRQEFDAAPQAKVLVISSEHLHSRLVNQEMISRLKEFLDPWVDRFEVVLYLRRQDRVAVSHYSTKIKSGNDRPVAFPGSPKDGLPYYFDYERIYENWCTVFGKESMRVRLFALREFAQGDLLRDFCTIVGLCHEGKKIAGVENEALNKAGADFMLELNRQWPSVIADECDEERMGLVQIVARLCRGKNYPVNRDEAAAFYRQFVEGNERLKMKIFPARSEPLFDDDFADYPEKIEQQAPRYEDAVALAIRIWKDNNVQ